MIPIRQEHTIQRHGVVNQSVKSNIRATPEMFDILSKAMYSNPIQAPVREYLANAADESDIIDVCIPTSLNPVFKVRDYGKGMSPSFVMTLFKDYGYSDKQQTNDKIGGFGIGSKSAYAYTNMFTVRSWQNNSVSTYECSKAEDGSFDVTHRGTRESREPSGVEIIVPVKSTDYGSFSVWIKHYCSSLSYFRGKTINGVSDLPVYTKIVDGLHSFEGTGSSINYHLSVTMGGIPYKLKEDVISHQQRQVLGNNIVFELPIGSVEVTASREEVRLSEHSREKLKTIIDRAVKLKTQKHIDDLSKLTTAYEKLEYTLDNCSGIANLIPGAITKLELPYRQCIVNRAGSVKTNYFNLDLHRYSYLIPILLIDTDKFRPSRIKRYCEENGFDLTAYSKGFQAIEGQDTKWLDDNGVPYDKLSDYEPLVQPRTKGSKVKTSSGGLAKGKALVVYYNNSTSYYDSKYTGEEELDLDSLPSNVYYYERKDEVRVADRLKMFGRFENLRDYKIISATSKNITKVSSCVPKIEDYLDKYVPKVKTKVIHSLLNKDYTITEEWMHLRDLSRDDFPYVARSHYYHSTTTVTYYVADTPSYDDIITHLPSAGKAVPSKDVKDYYDYCLKVIKAMKELEVNGVNLYKLINWSDVSDYKSLLNL